MTKSGFVSIIGFPNAGKSTLLNHLLKWRLSIVTNKVQTTRKSILGILTDNNYQIIFQDTPGILKEEFNTLHHCMSRYISRSLDDADIVIWINDSTSIFEVPNVISRTLEKNKIPIVLVLNKIDKLSDEKLLLKISEANNVGIDEHNIIPISALNNINIDKLKIRIVDLLPEHPFYYPEDTFTDRSERFYASEIIREQIFVHLEEELPYSSEVIIEEFKDEEKIIRILATVYVEYKRHKSIIIGKNGKMIETISVDSREHLKEFFGKDIFLKIYIKVLPKWRNNKNILMKLGY